ncbi:uncharacterized protein LOC134183382 isoform X2 [Corticium candelabrum]|uniref:uncharacterized protein LOC134183382 isoform X2 n=1 Tax=Corticium candelabrum TaxID=121492 RepID=UPI002E26C7A3|nr:uncharacterized protein LOC134183382 isoform X2 [Corticium candelabrum]
MKMKEDKKSFIRLDVAVANSDDGDFNIQAFCAEVETEIQAMPAPSSLPRIRKGQRDKKQVNQKDKESGDCDSTNSSMYTELRTTSQPTSCPQHSPAIKESEDQQLTQTNGEQNTSHSADPPKHLISADEPHGKARDNKM